MSGMNHVKAALDNSSSQHFSENSAYESPQKRAAPSNHRSLPMKILPTFIFDQATPQHKTPGKLSKHSTPRKKGSINQKVLNKSADKKSEKKSLKRSGSAAIKPKLRVNYSEIPNFEYQLEKMMRVVFRHCVGCPEFKEELKKFEADVILKHYADNRLHGFKL